MSPKTLIDRLRQAKTSDFSLVDKELKFGCHVGINKTEYFKENLTEHVLIFAYIEVDKKTLHKHIYFATDSTQGTYEEHIKMSMEEEKRGEKFKIYGTPPSMQRVMAFLEEKSSKEDWKDSRIKKAVFSFLLIWLNIDPTGSHDFFWLIENAGEHYKELETFCKDFIL